ncbi:MAG: TrkH family potassium uptake protein [Bacteroidales bacterium]|nr:TrkH family potassium uptake protein [Bacteroidales bacterium]
MNYRIILNILGKILLTLSAFMLTILPWIIYYKEDKTLWGVVIATAIPLVLGTLILFGTRSQSKSELRFRDGHLIVSSAWIVMGLAGSLPFYLTGVIPSFTDAVFESISGFTTTGSSILTDIESLPKSILYWRSLTHWIGGMGIIVLVIAILPALKVAGYQLLPMETSGIMPEKIKPRTTDIAKRLWGLYLLLTLALVALLMLGGLDFFESLCHAFGTVATGGYSTKNASVGYYSPYIQYVIMIFMLLSGINFALHYYLIRGKIVQIKKNTEVKVFLMIVFVTGVVITGILYFTQNTNLEKAFRDAFFQVISIITATGFATADYLQWIQPAWLIIMALMFVGACVGSTGGGIKVVRHVIVFKNIKLAFYRLLHPNAVKLVKINGQSVPDEIVGAVTSFVVIYILIIFAGSLLITFSGLDIQSALGAMLATLGGIGPGIGSVGPAGNFAHLHPAVKIFLSIIMIIGRLEIFTFFVIFSRGFWKR